MFSASAVAVLSLVSNFVGSPTRQGGCDSDAGRCRALEIFKLPVCVGGGPITLRIRCDAVAERAGHHTIGVSKVSTPHIFLVQ